MKKTFILSVFLVLIAPVFSYAVVINNSNLFNTKAKTAILIEANTGKVLYSKNGDRKMYPASMTKLLTLYIIFDQLKQKKISLDTEVTVSTNAYKKGGPKTGSSTMFLTPNSIVTVDNLIHGIATLSGNDATIAMAEAIAGSEQQFTVYMNLYAQKLGLNNSHFMNATGWPDYNHYSTAHDIATIARRLIIDFPEYYYYFNVPSFTYNGITQTNRNSLLFDKSMHVDGLKTGHTEAAGYNLIVSAVDNNGLRLIAVVDGLSSNNERTQAAKNLINWGFFNTKEYKVYKKGDLITSLTAINGSPGSLNIYATQDIDIIYNHNTESLNDFQVQITHNNIINSSIKKGTKLGQIVVSNLKNPNDTQIYPLYASQDIKQANFFVRFIKTPYYLTLRMFGKI
ncbi:D-alanyl-D-alanine carboxypeptidase family protein [Rickettsiales bacterium LUAb2]